MMSLLIILFIPMSPVVAKQIDIFTVKDIKVDITSDNAARARQKAFNEGLVSAFKKLSRRLLSEKEFKGLVVPDRGVISSLLRDYEITNEKVSNVRYVGTFTFRFQSKEVKEFLASEGLVFTDVGSQPILILPFYQYGFETVLWNPVNPWMAAWKRASPYKDILVPVKIPIGDLQDNVDIADNDALTYNSEAMGRIVDRYSTEEAIVMLAVPSWRDVYLDDPDLIPDKVTVMLYRTDAPKPKFAESYVVERSGDETKEELFDRAVKDARKALQRYWKSRTIIDPHLNNKLIVKVGFKTQKQWIETKKAIDNVLGVNAANLLVLSPDKAHIELLFNGSEQRLRLALQQSNLILTTPRIDFDSLYNSVRTGGQADASSLLMYELYLKKYH